MPVSSSSSEGGRVRRFAGRGVLLTAFAAAVVTGCANNDPVMPRVPVALRPAQALVDDFESAPNQNQYLGYWYTFVDPFGSAVVPAPNSTIAYASPGSPVTPGACFRFSGRFHEPSGIDPAYAGFGCTLNSAGFPLDMLGFTGIEFSARSGVGSKVRLILKRQSVAQVNGDFGIDLTLPTDWARIRVPFSDLRQAGGAQPVAFSVQDVTGLQWMPNKAEATFDFLIDDVKFY
jgi:hypothetical protein